MKSARTNRRTGTSKVVQKVLADIKIPKSDVGIVFKDGKKPKYVFLKLWLYCD